MLANVIHWIATNKTRKGKNTYVDCSLDLAGDETINVGDCFIVTEITKYSGLTPSVFAVKIKKKDNIMAVVIDRDKKYNITVSGKFLENLRMLVVLAEQPVIVDDKPVDISVRLGYCLGNIADEVWSMTVEEVANE